MAYFYNTSIVSEQPRNVRTVGGSVLWTMARRSRKFRKEIKMARSTKSDEELVQRVLEGGKKVQRAFAKWREQQKDKAEQQRSERSSRS